MEYSRKGIAEELRKELIKGYDVARISLWACNNLAVSRKERSLELDNIIRQLSLMDAGPEFEYTQKELKILIELLMNNEKDPTSNIERYHRPRYGDVIDVKIPGDRGVRFSQNGDFIGFLNP